MKGDGSSARSVPRRLDHRRLAAPTRLAITEAVRELLDVRRIEDVTVQEIVSRASISRPTFYAHFDTKYSVVAALIAEMGEAIYAHWLPIFESDGPISEIEMREVSIATLRGWRQQATLFSATIEGWHSNQEIHDTWNGILERFSIALTNRLAKARPLRPGDDMLVASLIVLFERCVYLAITAPESPLGRSDDDLADVLASMSIRCLSLDATSHESRSGSLPFEG